MLQPELISVDRNEYKIIKPYYCSLIKIFFDTSDILDLELYLIQNITLPDMIAFIITVHILISTNV